IAALRRADPDLVPRLSGDSPWAGEVALFLERETDLGPWEAQHTVVTPGGRYSLDFARPDLRLAVEADGAGAHVTTQGRADDAERDAELKATEWETVRIMRRHLADPAARGATASRLHRVAGARGWLGPVGSG
ncbi:MAG: DUF559 domain-containing protein, partial [Solirubrobacteraceae bacterium]